MPANRYSSLVVKVGTNVLTTDDGLLDVRVVRGLSRQIAALSRRGVYVILVSSGAMGAGRGLIEPSARLGVVTRRQVLAAVGQIRLIDTWARQLAREGVVCAQILATKGDFRDRHHYLNMRGCFEGLRSERILPIVNENDVVAVDELMFSDNDELAGLIASMMAVDALVTLTNVDGVYDGDPRDPASRVVATMPAKPAQWSRFVQPHKSPFGRGGMLTKCMHAHRLGRLGIASHICNGRTRDVLLRLAGGEQIGTAFTAAKRSLNGRKRWVAAGAGDVRGSISINAGAQRVITSGERVASILPVGIVEVEGRFERGDLIRVQDEAGREVGLGVACYGADRARELLGRKGERPLVHYDQLFLSD